MRAKYFPIIQHTEAFDLLMDAVESRRKGVVAGCDSKEASNELLRRLWLACFAEAEMVRGPSNATTIQGDVLDRRSPAEQVSSYLAEREQAHLELES